MKDRREVEKAGENMKVELGLFSSLVLFFSELFFTPAASLVNYLSSQNRLFLVCYWLGLSINPNQYSKCLTLINMVSA